MRLYTFVNFYLSSIQQGIQTQHVDRELTNKYVYFSTPETASQQELLREWSINHKTTYVMNGGNHNMIRELYVFLKEVDGFGFPYARFFEDEESLGSIITSVGIVLTENIYNAKKNEFSGNWEWRNPLSDDAPIVYAPDSDIGRYLEMTHRCRFAS